MIVRYANPSADRYLGRPALGEPIFTGTTRVHPDDLAKVEAARRAALDAPGVPQYLTHRFLRNDGGWWTVEASFTNYFDDPDIGALSYISRDISGRLEAERLLQESEERYRYLFKLSPDAVLVHRDGVILYANDAAARLFHAASAQALIGRDWHDLVAAENWPRVESRIAFLASGEAAFLPPAELDYLALDGQVIRVEATAARIMIDGAAAIMSVSRDITERRQAEAQRLAEARRQRDTLVREVHHRIKNHLQGLAGLLNQHRRRHPALRDVLDAVLAQINAISLIHGLQGREASARCACSSS
jgi:PAS domain S-box-containing protein